jgi:hypothetical protein
MNVKKIVLIIIILSQISYEYSMNVCSPSQTMLLLLIDIGLLGSLGQKMEAVCSSKTLISTYKSTRRYNPEDQHRHPHRRENVISHTLLLLSN